MLHDIFAKLQRYISKLQWYIYISRIAFKNFQYFLKYPIKLKSTCIPILNPGVKDTNIDTDKSKNKNIYNKYNNNKWLIHGKTVNHWYVYKTKLQ